MPLYEYECRKTGKRFEIIQKFSDDPLRTCPDCGGDVRRLISAPAIQFKGSGWYVNDYGKGGKKPPKEGSESKKGSDSKKESKPKESKKSD